MLFEKIRGEFREFTEAKIVQKFRECYRGPI